MGALGATLISQSWSEIFIPSFFLFLTDNELAKRRVLIRGDERTCEPVRGTYL